MKHINGIIVFAFLALLLLNVLSAGVYLPTTMADTQNTSNQPSNGQTVDNWAMYRHDIQRSGLSTSQAPNNNLLWKFFTGPSNSPSLADRLRASPTIVEGVVYIGSNNSIFYALNATSGATIWQVNVGSVIESSAAVVDNVVYVGILWDGHNGYVDAFNATNGALIWQFATTSGIESSPAVVNGVVYIGSFNGYVYALNAANGALKWSYLTGGSTFSSPAFVDGVVYIGSNDGKVYALNADSGALMWSFQTGDHIYASPAVVNNVVYVNTDNGILYALKASDGSKIWQATFGIGDHADDSPAVANGIVYIGARNGYYAFDATNGAQIWFFTSTYSQRQFGGYVYSSPIVAGNVVYFGSCDNYVFALNAFDGSMIWSYRVGGFLFSSPSVVKGVLFIGSYDGYVYALGGTPVPPPTPTPQPTVNPSPTPNADDWPILYHDLNRTGTSTATASNGNLLWQFNTGDKVYSSPVIANGVVYEGSWKGYVYALNAATGAVIWQYNCGSMVQ